MRLIVKDGCLHLSGPDTRSEMTFLENLHTIASGGWGNPSKLEFEVATMSASGEVTHACLKLVIPPEFEDDLTGTGGVVKKEERCQHCGGPNH